MALRVDSLEARQLLSAVPSAGPTFEILRPRTGGNPPGVSGYTPAQVQQAYGFSQIAFGGTKGDGTGETIAIVDAYNDPNIQSDLNTFDAQFGLAATTVTRVNQSGGTSLPASDSTGGWELEESLDVEWAHAIAPGAKIVLVEANSSSDNDLLAGVAYAATSANVVSMSWGGGEFSGENSYDGDFSKAGVAFVASSGDNGAPISWPAASPNVLSVGGTALSLNGSGYVSEVGWSGSGGGPSAYESQPSYQSGVVTQTGMRANPDVAYDASPSTGFAVYDSVPYSGTTYGWLVVGGTSAGAPQWSALLAIADQGRAVAGQPALDSASPQEVMTTLYKSAGTAAFHDVTSGTSTGSPNYNAGPGYDYVIGIGSPVANLVVQALDGTVTQGNSDHLALSGSTSVAAGSAFSLTVTAQNAGGTDAAYAGTVHFTSSDAQAGLPGNYTFTAADHGSHTFSVTLKTAGNQSITATDTTTASVVGTLSGIAVSPAAASQILLTGLSSSATAGTAQTVTVTAKDAYGNVATGYADSVHFTSTDTAALLPADYAFTASDKGVHGFSVTFETAGTQSLTVTGTPSGLSASQSGIAVSPASPTGLAAKATSASQITLTWTGSAGALSYLIERSTSSTTGFAQIGTTAVGTTTYADSGLTAGTTYYYRVRAAGGGFDSSYSSIASATTTGGSATTDTIWSNSYTPPENAYAAGSYDVGVKFESSVAGTVTGARFYKQTWMGGYTHNGYLWSSTGTLLASARFTGETSYGWQGVSFSNPVAIAANTVYIVSFSTGGGYFGITTGFFNGGGVVNGPLQALAEGVSGGDGVYSSGTSTFPTVDSGGMNFWADVAFKPSGGVASVANGGSSTSGGLGTLLEVAPTPSGTGLSPAQALPQGPSAVAPISWLSRRSPRLLIAQGPTSTRVDS